MSSFGVGSISGGILWDNSGLAKGMMQAGSIASVFPSVVTSFIANPILGAIDLTKKLGESLLDVFTSCTEGAHNVGILASEVGASTERLSGLGRMAKNYGSDIQGVADAYRFLGRNISEAMHGSSEAQAKLQSVGFTFADIEKGAGNLDWAFMKVTGGLHGLATGAEKSEAAMGLLGKGGAAMLPMINKGTAAIEEQMDKYKKLGVLTSSASAESAGKWEEMVGDLKAAWDGIKAAFATPLRNALLPMLEKITDWVVNHQEDVRKWIERTVKKFGDAVDAGIKLADAIGKISDNFDALSDAIRPALALLSLFNSEEDKQRKAELNTPQSPPKAVKPTGTSWAAIGAGVGFVQTGLSPVGLLGGYLIGRQFDPKPEPQPRQTGHAASHTINVKIEGLDTREASSQIADKIHGPLRASVERQKQDFAGAAMADRIRKGL